MLKKIAAAIRSMMAAMGKLVVIPIRLADGALTYIVQLIKPSPVAMPDVETVDDQRDAANDNVTSGFEIVGALVRKASSEMLEHGVVLDRSIPVEIRNFVVSIGREDLEAIYASGDDVVGRHFDGQATIEVVGFGPVRHPDVDRDARDAKEHAARVERRARAYRPQTPICAEERTISRAVGLTP